MQGLVGGLVSDAAAVTVLSVELRIWAGDGALCQGPFSVLYARQRRREDEEGGTLGERRGGR